ncbi:MAG: sigma-70 family RNA polymerase sigma factor [Acidobacteriota bacterium]
MDRTLDRLWAGAEPRPGWKVSVTPDAAESEAGSADLTAASDPDLVSACLAGRREAFDVIVERHQRQVYHLCYRFVGNHEEASDLAQDVFLRSYRALGGFKGTSAFATWLYRIGVNVCLNRMSAKGKTPRLGTLETVDPVDTRAERADARLLRGERAAEVRAAIAQLPNKQRATLILRVYHELPHEQIAGILGSSVGAVKANFFHALANLRKRLQPDASSPS